MYLRYLINDIKNIRVQLNSNALNIQNANKTVVRNLCKKK